MPSAVGAVPGGDDAVTVPARHHTPCPNHRGIFVDHSPCHRCGYSLPTKEAPVTPLTVVTESVDADVATVTVDGTPVADVSAAIEKAARDTWKQPSLSDALFPPVRKSDTPMVKVTISGTVEMTQADYLAYLDGARIGPGAVVEIRAAGYVVQPGAAWVRRTEGSGEDKQVWHEREGRVKVKITELAGLSPTGEEFSE